MMSSEYPQLEEVNIVDYIKILLKFKVLIIFLVLLSMATGLGYYLYMPKLYMAKATLLPSQQSSSNSGILGSLGGLASAFGFGGSANEEDSKLYQDILLSRRFLTKYIETDLNTSDSGKTVRLPELLNMELSPSDPEFLLNATKKLSHYLFDGHLILTIKENNIVEVSLLTPDPRISATLLNLFINDLDKFNQTITTKKAKENREFIQRKMEEASLALKESEDELSAFNDKNRSLTLSPSLQLEAERLSRRTRINLEMFITFKKEFELAKIQENKETATISILDFAEPPSSHSEPKFFKVMCIAAFSGLTGAVIFTFLLSYIINVYPVIKRELNIS